MGNIGSHDDLTSGRRKPQARRVGTRNEQFVAAPEIEPLTNHPGHGPANRLDISWWEGDLSPGNARAGGVGHTNYIPDAPSSLHDMLSAKEHFGDLVFVASETASAKQTEGRGPSGSYRRRFRRPLPSVWRLDRLTMRGREVSHRQYLRHSFGEEPPQAVREHPAAGDSLPCPGSGGTRRASGRGCCAIGPAGGVAAGQRRKSAPCYRHWPWPAWRSE